MKDYICPHCIHVGMCYVPRSIGCVEHCNSYKPDPQYQKEQNEEEWLKSLNTEQLAEFIRKQRDDWSDGWYSDCHRFEEIVEWLKQPHKE